MIVHLIAGGLFALCTESIGACFESMGTDLGCCFLGFFQHNWEDFS